jgi:hypothetical protein
VPAAPDEPIPSLAVAPRCTRTLIYLLQGPIVVSFRCPRFLPDAFCTTPAARWQPPLWQSAPANGLHRFATLLPLQSGSRSAAPPRAEWWPDWLRRPVAKCCQPHSIYRYGPYRRTTCTTSAFQSFTSWRDSRRRAPFLKRSQPLCATMQVFRRPTARPASRETPQAHFVSTPSAV